MEKRLAPVFVENRVIRMTRYAIRFMPPIAVFTLCWQIALGGQLGPGGCHSPVCAQFTDARHVVAGKTLRYATPAFHPELVL
ncbi:Uncharacterized protein conserved in bacteria [Citrobacter koseri]|nr:Uncharacterized protein conserved in bacteria [Citrobacter koseri]